MLQRQKKWTLGAPIIGSGMAFINGSVVNVALPAIQTELDGSVSDMQWVISIYTFILGPLILVGNRLEIILAGNEFSDGVISFFTGHSVVWAFTKCNSAYHRSRWTGTWWRTDNRDI